MTGSAFSSSSSSSSGRFGHEANKANQRRPAGSKPPHHSNPTLHHLKGKAAFLLKRKQLDEQKRNQKSKMLREYAKLCKREGIRSDRVNMSDDSGSTEVKHPNSSSSSPSSSSGNGKQVAKKSNPFHAAELEAQHKTEEKEQAARRKEEVQKEIAQKHKQREHKRVERMKRTRKGQPIMANQIMSILGKLQRDKNASK